MKVKELKWDNSPHYARAKDKDNGIEYIIEKVCIHKDCCNNENRYIAYAKQTIDITRGNNLQEVKETCQEHFEKSILDPMEM